ncbi:septum formation family protein, partial [Streptomyces sp. T-3]|nr:septum formation family protein [Streptomyces sp. T-3]
PPGGDGPGRRMSRGLVIALVVAVAVALGGAGWGAWATFGDDDGKPKSLPSASPSKSRSSKSPSPTGPVLPYGEEVGIEERLEAGDCVNVVWSGTEFKSVPSVGKVSCDEYPEGQVMALETAQDHEAARRDGPARCEQQVKSIAEAMPDADVYAVVPSEEGFTEAGGATACLVVGRHAAIGGEVGRFRDAGINLTVSQMTVGDCWNYSADKENDEYYYAPMTDCANPHDYQVIGAVSAPKGMKYEKGVDNAHKICGNKYENSWAPGSDRWVLGWPPNKADWGKGMTTVVCTVSNADSTKMTGKIDEPGNA